jgi:hypothetical protein
MTERFFTKFLVPYNKGEAWSIEVGRPMLNRLGCCAKTITTKKKVRKSTGKKTWEERIDKIQEVPGECTSDDVHGMTEIESSGFQGKICIKEKGHRSKCSHQPYLPKQQKFGNTPKEDRDPLKVAINGIIAKIKDPENNPGGDPCPLQNRGGGRNNITMFDKDTEKRFRATAKKQKREKYFTNLAIRLSMGANPIQIATATLDMMATIYHSRGCAEHFTSMPSAFKNILSKRWNELKQENLNQEMPLVISDRDDYFQDPINHRTIDILDYGKGHTDLNGIQFGHKDPISEIEWKTHGGNVLPLPRGSNLKQSNGKLEDVPLQQFLDSIEQISRLKENNRLTPAWQHAISKLNICLG